MSKITIITGPMFSGKTTELLRLYSREEIAKKKSILFKPLIDNRYSENKIVNHDGKAIPAIVVSKTHDILDNIKSYISSEENKQNPLKNVFIDEVQFFDSDIIDAIKEITIVKIDVYVSGLNQTYTGDPFPFKDGKNHIGYLMAISDFIIHLDAVCNKCGKTATKTYRKGNSKETILVGGTDKYQARCTDCFNDREEYD